MSDDPVEPIANLGKRLRTDVEAIGLELKHFGIVPDLDGTDHKLTASFVLGVEPPTEDDAEFERIMQGQREIERQQRVEEERKQLESLRDDLKRKDHGIGLDD